MMGATATIVSGHQAKDLTISQEWAHRQSQHPF
jgi:hypothetical protein